MHRDPTRVPSGICVDYEIPTLRSQYRPPMPVHQVMGLCLPAGTVSHGVVLLAPFKEVMGSECRVATGSPSSISSPFGSVRQYRAVHWAVRGDYCRVLVLATVCRPGR